MTSNWKKLSETPQDFLRRCENRKRSRSTTVVDVGYLYFVNGERGIPVRLSRPQRVGCNGVKIKTRIPRQGKVASLDLFI